MKLQQFENGKPQQSSQRATRRAVARRAVTAAVSAAAAMLSAGSIASAAVLWDAEAGTSWWYNPVNWNTNSNDNTTLPNTGTQNAQATEINNGWDFAGEGVVFDPANDPHFQQHQIDPYLLATFYLGNTGDANNKFTLKSGTLDGNTGTNGATIIARNTANRTSIFVQQGGTFRISNNSGAGGSLQLAAIGSATGIYQYHGGNLEIALAASSGPNGIRLGQAGSGAVGKFIVHNDGPAGQIKTGNFHVAFGAGTVGIVEFHLSNQAASGNFGIRPIQVINQLSLRNPGSGAARLDLQLDEAPIVNGSGVPQNLGLIDYSTLNSATGFPNTDYFYDVTGTTAYEGGSTVRAVHGKHYYDWTIDYKGQINFSNAATSQVASVSAAGGLGTDVVLLGQGSQLGSQWLTSGAGHWGGGGNWSAGVPNAPGVIANLISIPSGDVDVIATVDLPVSVGHLNFESTRSYTVSGENAITLDVLSGQARVNVYSGNHVVSAPVVLADDTTVTVNPVAASVALANLQESSVKLTKAGAGTLEVNNVRTGALAINAGTVKVTPNGTAAGVSSLPTLSIAPGGKLDLTNNSLVVRGGNVGSWNGSAYTGVTGMVQSGRNEGTWDGSGIMTSLTEATTDYTTLGVASASDVLGIGPDDTEVWAGQTVRGSDTLVKYTYGGDANLDGMLNIDDYGQIDFNVGLSGVVFGYFNGDFNYDGLINIDDYGIIDFNIGIQGPPFDTSGGATSVAMSSGVAAVPEPASFALLTVAGAATLRRRRRAR